MCLIAVAVGRSAAFPLLLAANRDERHARPALPAGWWADRPQVFGGRDLAAGGSWLAVDRGGRVAAVTNFRAGAPAPAERSRGELVTAALTPGVPWTAFAAEITARADRYGPFSLLLADSEGVRYLSNRAESQELGLGVHVLSNASLDADWPKLATARAGMERALAAADPIVPLLQMLAWRSAAATLEQRYVSSHFIAGPVYGTRCSTAVAIDAAGRLTFVERSFDAAGQISGEVRERFPITQAAPTDRRTR
jgi:uncharacterized protein with NRDE domain